MCHCGRIHLDADRPRVGSRVCATSEAFEANILNLKRKQSPNGVVLGTVVAPLPRDPTSIKILVDGNRFPTYYHVHFWQPITED